MKVRDLIAELSKCDPEAEVVINDEPMIEDDRNLMESSMQSVTGIERGWADGPKIGISWDITFMFGEVPGYSAPAVRLIGVNSEPTANSHVIINGVHMLPVGPG